MWRVAKHERLTSQQYMECGKTLQVSIDGNVTIDLNSGATSKVQQVSKFCWHEHQSNNKRWAMLAKSKAMTMFINSNYGKEYQ